MTQAFYYSPGQLATVVLETFGVTGSRADSPVDPIITRILTPPLSDGYHLDPDGYTHPMVKLSTGLYYYQFTLPVGAKSIGTYFVDGYYVNPTTMNSKNIGYQIVVSAVAGNYGLRSSA